MKKRYLFKAIGVFEIVTGVTGGAFMLWTLFATNTGVASPAMSVVYLCFAVLFILAGFLLFEEKTPGIWLSVIAQLIAIPSYADGDFTFGFNNILRFFIHLSTEQSVIGFDVGAAVLFFFLALSLPSSNKPPAEQ